ncbi:MAG: hypothetical protein Q4F24_08090 [Eubacteriales bacterium]|nr:hypothetical protein [Eubacteriales bacterium]
MSFKEAIKNDILSTFLNLQEFGEIHMVDGREMTVIVDNLEMVERAKAYKKFDRFEAEKGPVYLKHILFYVSKAEFGALPTIGRMMRFDGKEYFVTDAINEDGIYSISLERKRIA